MTGMRNLRVMVSTHQLLAFSAMALAIILIPGPSVLFVVGRALAHGGAPRSRGWSAGCSPPWC
ncbi:hypothetical protein ACFQY7_27165 [Actinomadura luteofluorescens]|uniref:hypothetical protein n=1 Tax=Actinomadura luteofluorescens TaxID=46163 RepID=UPI0036375F49